MKRNAAYSLVVFLLLASYLLFGLLTQLLMGTVKWEDAPLFLGITASMSALAAGVFYFLFTKLGGKFASQDRTSSPNVLGRQFMIVSAVLIVITSALGTMQSYSVSSEQRDLAERQRREAARAAEAKRQRTASLTPEQRAAEEKQKRENAAAAAKAAAKEVARNEVAKAKASADKKKRDAQLQLAGLGAVTLKRAAKDPEAFELRSLVVKENGTACYEYRAKNSFGAILPSSAVLTTSGKMLLQEHDGNAFVNVWNKNCTPSGGDEIAPLVKRLGILD